MNGYNITKKACYLSGISMAVAANLSPILFVIFKNMYGLSYTMIGFLVVINFVTQLLVDLVFTVFAKYFNIHKTVRAMPVIIFVGLWVYGLLPKFFPELAFLWIFVGTIIFSVSAGLSEVLVSPVIAAIASDNSERDMSMLHSMYAWGTVGVVILSTVFIKVFGGENWIYLAFIWSVVPLIGFIMFKRAKLPDMNNFGEGNKRGKFLNKGIILCTLCIFLGGAAECTMSQWASGFIEKAIGVPKVYGDVLGDA